MLVLIGDVHRGVVRAIQYARTLAPTAAVSAVYVETDPAQTRRLEEKWARWGLGVPLVVLTSPYRSLLRPLLDYVDQIQSRGDDMMVTVVLPEFLPRRWWQHILHNQTALLVKGALLFRAQPRGRRRALSAQALIRSSATVLKMPSLDALTLFGLIAVIAMLVCYALEARSPWFVLAFAGACVLGSVYGFLQGAWPFGLVEAIWALVALRRWRRRAT